MKWQWIAALAIVTAIGIIGFCRECEQERAKKGSGECH